jgi:hypothetical protein
MTETTARIRWESNGYGGLEGYAGTLNALLFDLWQSPGGHVDILVGEWILTGHLPMSPASEQPHGPDLDDIKAKAEKWLEEFVSSLGAIFPGAAYEFPGEDGEPLEVKYAAGRRVRFAHPDEGYPGEGAMAAAKLTLGAVYTIVWADIGQSRTDLNLTAKGAFGGGVLGRFNSVLFEPADDAEAAGKKD